jgi:hypothetical protein
MAGILGKEDPARASAIEKIDSALRQFLPQPLGDNLLAGSLFSLPHCNAPQFPLAFHGYLEQKRRVTSSRRLGNGKVVLPGREEQCHEHRRDARRQEILGDGHRW